MGHWKRNLILWILLLLVVAGATMYLFYQKRQREIDEANKKAAHDALIKDLIETEPNPVYTQAELKKMKSELIYNSKDAPQLSPTDRQTILDGLLKDNSAASQE